MKWRVMAVLCAVAALLVVARAAWADFVTEPGSPYPVGAAPYTLYTGDFNGDGRPDVATVNGTSSNVSVYLRQPGGGFAEQALSPFPVGAGPSGGALADFNGDGRLDMAVSNFVDDTVSILLGQPGGAFAAEGSAINVGTRPSAIAAGNFNGDARPDFAISEQDLNAVAVYVRNPGNTGFSSLASYPVGSTPGPIAVGDFNGDGLSDLAVVNTASNSVSILLQSAGGGFAAEGTAVPVGARPLGIVAADLDGNGSTDLAVANANDSTVSILLRNATNTGFTPTGAPLPVATAPIGIVAADFDRDGHADLAVAANGSGSGGAVDILRGTGGGAFGAAVPIPFSTAEEGIAAADFSGDGRPDLAVSDVTNSTFSALLNPAPPAPPAPTATPTPTPVPPPVAGKSVNVKPVSGKVKIKRPGARTYVTLTAGAQIPVGSSIDTRAGRITITAAQGKGKTASSDFYDGLFTVTQTKGSKPLTTLKLTEKLSCPARAKSASAAAKKPKTRKLWGDGHGSFRTQGQYSAATVRGTKWLTQDTCTSTLTRVVRGVVSVRDNVKHKTILLRAGKRYTARRR